MTVRAWLLDWPSQPLALGLCEVIEIVDAPEVHRVPFGPHWCRGLLYWRDQMLPLAVRKEEALDNLKIVVVAYQKSVRTPLQYAALVVRSAPRQIEVHGSMDCDTAADCALGANQLRACFKFEERAIVVPELRLVFEAA
jgi:chemotaxis signal transduction protein